MLLGLGGTGQHVALSYYHLSRLANFEPDDVCIIDSDIHTTNKNSINYKLRDFKHIHSHYTDPIFIRPFPEALSVSQEGRLFKDVFNDIHADEKDEILKIFFEKPILEHSIERGFFAKPIMGAITTRLWLEEYDNNVKGADHGDTPTAQEVHELDVTIENAKKIGLVFSNFGGTGSGCISSVLKRLLKKKKSESIFGLVHRNWFSISSGMAGNVSPEQLKKNAHSGLHYYTKILENDLTPLFIFDLPSKLTFNALAPSDQPENVRRHIINILTAATFNHYNGKKEMENDIYVVDWDNIPDRKLKLRYIYIMNLNNKKDSWTEGWTDVSKAPTLDTAINISAHTVLVLDYLVEYLRRIYGKEERAIENLIPKSFEEKIRNRETTVADELEVIVKKIRESIIWISEINSSNLGFYDSEFGASYNEWGMCPERFKGNEESYLRIFRRELRVKKEYKKSLLSFFSSAGSYLQDILNDALQDIGTDADAKKFAEQIYNKIYSFLKDYIII